MKYIHMIFLAMLLMANTACAASFDCAKASTKVEQMICADPEISKLDEELGAAYSKALRETSDPSAFKQQQRGWMKERNKCVDMECLKSSYQNRSHELKSTMIQEETSSRSAEKEGNEAVIAADSSRPGFYRLYMSTNDSVCIPLGRIINGNIKKYGQIRFDTHDGFVKWREVGGDVARYTYDGEVKQADVDINNDGVVEQVIRTQWSIGNAPNDQLSIFQNEIQNITSAELDRAHKTISFNPGNYWIDRGKKRYGDPFVNDWVWFFDGVASIDLLQLDKEIFVVAANIYPSDVLTKIYVFQLSKEFNDYEENDVCMFLRICPCGGCQGAGSGDLATKTLPDKKWCQ